jgi:hypothetical protein
MPGQVVQAAPKGRTAGADTISCSFGALPAAGRAVVVVVWGYSGVADPDFGTSAVTDNQGNTYARSVQAPVRTLVSDNVRAAVFACESIGAPSGTFTVTANGANASDTILIGALEVAGLLTSSALDKVASASGAATTAPTSGTTATTAQADEFLVSVYVALAGGVLVLTADAASGWVECLEETDSNTYAGGEADTRTVTATGAYSHTWTTASNQYTACIASFKADASYVPFVEPVLPGAPAFTATNAATLAPGLPPGWRPDDIHVLVALRNDNTAETALTGWTAVAALTGNNTTAQRVAVWWRRAVGGDTAPTVTFGSSTIARGARIYGARYCIATGDPFDTGTGAPTRSPNATADLTVEFTNLTTTVANCLVLAIIAFDDDPATVTTLLSGYVRPPLAYEVAASALGNDLMLGFQYRLMPAAGSAGLGTITVGTATTSVSTGLGIALLPEPVAPAATFVPFLPVRAYTRF